MTLTQLATLCRTADHVTLVVPRPADGKFIRMFPISGPRGLVIETDGEQTIARFKSRSVLKWIRQESEPRRKRRHAS